MSASTDARVSSNDRSTNLVNVGGRDAGTSPVWRVKINGKSTFVQTRLNENGSISYVANEKVGDIERPYVLGTVNKDGAFSSGGSGRTYRTDNFGRTSSGDIRIGAGPGSVEVTDSATALAILSTGTINGKTATQSQQLDLGYTKALGLSKQRQSNNVRSVVAPPDSFVPAQRQTADREDRDQVQVTPHNVDEESKVTPGDSPGNNDDGLLSNELLNNIGDNVNQFAGVLGDKVEELLPKAIEIFQNMKFSDKDIENFNKLFEQGGGDEIANAMYPLDNTYGQIRGQDYVTIDQFIYQPPRADQIFGTGDINPIENLTRGQQRRSPLKKFVAMVKLPMPNNITDSNAVSWGDDAMNNLSATLTAGVMRNPAMTGLIGGGLSLINPTLGKLGALGVIGMQNDGIVGADGKQDASASGRAKALAQMLQQQGGDALLKTNLGAGILGMLGVNVSPESLLARGFGVIPNSNTELLFNKVTLRTFQFSWRMSPRDEREAREVKKIIRFFKQGMAAKTMNSAAGQRTLYLGTPNVFRLQYRTARGEIIEGVNRIKPCAVVGTAVNYTPDGQWSAYDKGQPVSTTISIEMKELEPVYASDYSTNVIKGRRSGEEATQTRSFEETETVFDGGEETTETRTVSYEIPVGEGDLYSIRPSEVGY